MTKYTNNLWREERTDRRGKKLVRWHAKKVVKGRQRYGTFRTKDLAEQWLDKLEAQAFGLEYGYIDDSLGEVMSRFVEIKSRPALNRSPHTIEDYTRSWNMLERVLGRSASCDLTERQVDLYVNRRQIDGAGNRRILKELKHLRWAIRRVLDREPAWRLPEIRPEPTETRVPPDDEIAAVYSTLDRAPMRRAFLLALLTGMRPEDVFRARREWLAFDPSTWSSIKDRARVLNIEMTKRKGRKNPTYVTETLAEALAEVGPKNLTLAGTTQGALKSALARRTGREDPEKSFRPLKSSLHLEHTWNGVHALRHVVATWLADAEFSEEEIGLVLGHGAETVAGKHYVKSIHFPIKKRALEAVERRFLEALAVHTGKKKKVVEITEASR